MGRASFEQTFCAPMDFEFCLFSSFFQKKKIVTHNYFFAEFTADVG